MKIQIYLLKFYRKRKFRNKKNKTIVYITDKCYPSLSRQAEFMKKNGYKTFLISMDSFISAKFRNDNWIF